MLKFLAKRWAKASYVFRQHVEAETNLLNAGLARRTAAEKHSLAAQLTKDAEAMDARIKNMDEKLEKGFWECENGHEHEIHCDCAIPGAETIVHAAGCPTEQCSECGKPMKLIKRDQMTGQEKYESDRERKDAEDLAQSKRDQAKAEEENAAQSEKTAKYFQTLAAQNRNVAQNIKSL